MAAPKQHNTNGEKADLRTWRIPENRKDKPTKLRHKDWNARRTLKFTKAKPQDDADNALSRPCHFILRL
ncbi:hypothetical protein GGR01_001609 [Acetobacter oeni]|nr:hypothetical protein [Acetobacter oeni]